MTALTLYLQNNGRAVYSNTRIACPSCERSVTYNSCKESTVSLGKVKENKWYPLGRGGGQAMSLIELGSKVRVFHSGLFENGVPSFSTIIGFEFQYCRDDLKLHPQVSRQEPSHRIEVSWKFPSWSLDPYDDSIIGSESRNR
ncbi:MAG: hypothetical protein JRN67_04655 [Nitrososphaerota archaeon]|nr:hypothetical protein [Nitrososphaerota archaeon]